MSRGGLEDEGEDEDENTPLENTVADGGSASTTGAVDVVPLEKTQADLDAAFQKRIRNLIRDALFSDFYIQDTPDDLEIQEDGRMRWILRRCAVFLALFLKESYLDDWLTRHEDTIGTDFNV
ncbi:hypothetical protein BGZ58_010641 [Dissophora ornata]|nr:hypothetical protein BGZ58_010641 [Dissophora ornata]